MFANVLPSANGLLATSAASSTATRAVDVTERAEPVFTAVARTLTVTFAVPEDPARSDQVYVALSPPARLAAGGGPLPTGAGGGGGGGGRGKGPGAPPPAGVGGEKETEKVPPGGGGGG